MKTLILTTKEAIKLCKKEIRESNEEVEIQELKEELAELEAIKDYENMCRGID